MTWNDDNVLAKINLIGNAKLTSLISRKHNSNTSLQSTFQFLDKFHALQEALQLCVLCMGHVVGLQKIIQYYEVTSILSN